MKNSGFSIQKGKSNFISEVRGLNSPRGMIPLSLSTEYAPLFGAMPNIAAKSQLDFYEFFVYDDNAALIILSVDPFFYIKIESPDFYNHLSNELAQLNAGVFGTDKVISTNPFYKTVGEYSVEVYFSPKEMKYSSSGVNKYRIIDNNGTTYVDAWILLEAGRKNTLYLPMFEEEKLNEDIKTWVEGGDIMVYRTDIGNYGNPPEVWVNGRENMVYTNFVNVTSPANYTITPVALNFSFMVGRDLLLTENLLGVADMSFTDLEELTQHCALFFTLPLGNSKGVNNNLSTMDGIAVVVRGNHIDRIIDFFEREGIPIK